MRFWSNLKMTKTSSISSIHQEKKKISYLHSNLIILTDFHSITVIEDKLQNLSISRFLLRYDNFGQNLKMTKTS